MNHDLLKRLDRILNEVNDAIEEMDPDSEEASLLFGPTQELGYAVDQMLTLKRAQQADAP